MSAVFERQKSLCKNHWIGSYHPELVPPGNARFKSLAQLSGNVLFESVVRCGPKTTGSFYLIFWFFSSRARFSILTWEDQLQIALRLLADREKNFWEKIKCWCNILIVYERTSPALHLCFTCTVAKRVDDYSPNLVLEVHNICSIMEATESNEITNSILHQPREQPSWKCQSISTV